MTQSSDTPAQIINRPNPELVAFIVSMTKKSQEEDSDSPAPLLLYLTIRSVFRTRQFRVAPTQFIPVCFSYYLEAYPYLMTKEALNQEVLNRLTNEAALSLFDNYLIDPEDLSSRRMLTTSAHAIHEIAVEQISAIEEIDLQTAMTRLSSVAILTQTVKEYIGRTRRKKNLHYIQWLKEFLHKVLNEPTLSFLDHDPEVKTIVAQVSSRLGVIEVNPVLN